MRESKIKWVGIYSNRIMRQELVNKIVLTDILLQDTRGMHLDDMTEDEIPVFTTDQGSVRPYEFDDAVHLSISYEMDLNKYTIDRTVYTSLDWLGDVGGLMDILFLIGSYPVLLL